MTIEERNYKLKKFITCLKCDLGGKCCDDNCPTQYEAGNMGEIIENLEAISKALEQEPCKDMEREYEKAKALFSKVVKSEDCISRQAVLDLPKIKIHNEWGNVIKESVDVEDIRQLPSINLQEPKTDKRMIEKIKQYNFVMDESGYTDHGLVEKVNEIIDAINKGK